MASLRKRRSQAVQCDAEKIVSLRKARAMTQEKLALLARVERRTVQRAEAGAAVSAETLADLAAALGVPPDALLARAEPGEDENQQEGWVTARPVESGRKLLEDLKAARLASLEYEVEPTRENLSLLKNVVSDLAQHLPPDPWDEAPIHEPRQFPSVVQQLESIANLNERLRELEAEGLALFMAQHVEAAVMPIYGLDEGHYYTTHGQRPELVRVVRLVLGRASADKMKVPRRREWPVQIVEELEDEVPF
ncbi:helix-turn-helix domain-containing protein [Phenylobacterium soli]|uniref:HTH cro/C1-type domain-containing protein n=1 Tax=Phenylobacterium soli TaxID=2170551 RepID=A0A328AFM0_9CAUL|nr:helix-turn-helix transcriptional regulator [Phenylobacterium soli]RAK53542.1 hypothetical protein DJ017_02865 [Phenylobacterium soli]